MTPEAKIGTSSSLEDHLCLPCGWQGSSTWVIHCLPRHISRQQDTEQRSRCWDCTLIRYVGFAASGLSCSLTTLAAEMAPLEHRFDTDFIFCPILHRFNSGHDSRSEGERTTLRGVFFLLHFFSLLLLFVCFYLKGRVAEIWEKRGKSSLPRWSLRLELGWLKARIWVTH